MGAKLDILTFSGGWVDALAEPARTLVNHARGARRLENFLPLPYGPATTRPPLRWLASAKNQGQNVRLLRLTYSDQYTYMLEFGHKYVRFYTNEGQILDGAAAYELATPYPHTKLADLSVQEDAGTLYLAHPEYAPQRLVYTSDVSWTLEEAPFTWGPFCDENTSEITLTPSDVDGDITLTASAAVFAAGHIGRRFLLGHRVATQALTLAFSGVATSGTIYVPRDARWKMAATLPLTREYDIYRSATLTRITTTGIWTAQLLLEKSYDEGGSWELVMVLDSSDDTQWDEPGDEAFDDALYRFRVAAHSSGSGTATLQVLAHYHWGYAIITDVTSPTEADATVIEPLASATETLSWAEPAWSGVRGYPRCIGLIDNRLVLGATLADPTTLWLSHTNHYMDMRTGLSPADALRFTFTTRKGDPFLWILAEQYKWYIGTPSAILEMQAADPRSSISAENKPEIARRIEFGSAAVPPVRAHAATILMDAGRLRPMKVAYDWEQDLLLAPPLAQDCPTATEPGIKRLVFTRGRVPIVWALRDDGKLLAMVYEQGWREESSAWALIETAGVVQDIAGMPGTGGDQLWVAVDRIRTQWSLTFTEIERLDPVDLAPVRATAHALDSYMVYDGGAAVALYAFAVNAGTGCVTVTPLTSNPFTNGQIVRCAGLLSNEDITQRSWYEGKPFMVADRTGTTFVLKTADGTQYIDGRIVDGGYAPLVKVDQATVGVVAQTMTGLDHLEWQLVHVVADGACLGPYRVRGGEITLPEYVRRAYIGLFADAVLQPLRVVVPTPDGSTRGRMLRVDSVWLAVYRSWDFQIGPAEDRLRTITCWEEETEINVAPELVSRDFWLAIGGGLTLDPTIIIKRSLPLPLTVSALMLNCGVGETTGGRG